MSYYYCGIRNGFQIKFSDNILDSIYYYSNDELILERHFNNLMVDL